MRKEKAMSPLRKECKITNFLKRYGLLYFMILPGLIYLIVFKYLPMFGLVIAFKNYHPSMGFSGIFTSKLVGLKHFKKFLSSYYFGEIMRNTMTISLTKFAIGFPLPILLAVMLNELRGKNYKQIVQTACYMPNFMSWVVTCGIIVTMFASDGIFNQILGCLGVEPQTYLSNSKSFFTILIASDVWKYCGWDSIIYLAAITSIDPNLYEAAAIDGAGKFRQVLCVTLPCIRSVIGITLILRMGGILEAGFEQILLLYSPAVYDVADIIDTYVYREGLANANYSFSTAVGLFKSVLAMIMVILSNKICKKATGEGLW